MELRVTAPIERGSPGPQRRSLVPYLLGVIGLQGCLYLGMLAAPWAAAGREALPSRPPADPTLQWRRSRYDPARDPTPGMELPVHTLARVDGTKVPLVQPGKRTALLFVGDPAG